MFSNKHALLKKGKTSHIFGTDRDILKIRKVLNSAYHEEQKKEVSQKSANFSCAGVKGIPRRMAVYCTTVAKPVDCHYW